MNNKIDTRSVSELILNKETPDRQEKVEHYVIPYYQRGYRWEVRHVKYLLKDIDAFISEGTTNDYCLQPIVVTPQIDCKGKIEWEVIDGQQRLITLFLIFQCINRPKFQLEFEQRPKSTDFVKQLNENTYKHDDPDFHYMSDAHETIKKFFDEKLKTDIGYIDTFNHNMKRVKIIWYEIGTIDDKLTEEEKIDIFNNLNIGKIPLTDAELIRALLLSKIKIGLNDRESNLRQAEISEEWNRIEHELRNEEFWGFLNLNCKKQKEETSHIEFIFNLMAGSEAENYTTYLWFENQIIDYPLEEQNQIAKNLWDDVKLIFGQLKSWFNKRTLYHYIGFLLIVNENKYSIHTIRAKQNEFSTKTKFRNWLKECVEKEIESIDIKKIIYGKNSDDVNKILLLFNILSLQELPNIPQNRFPFHSYKDVKEDGGWSIEHVHAQNSEELKDIKHITTWLDKTLAVIKNIKSVEKVIKDETNEEQKETIEIQPYLTEIEDLLKKKDKPNLDIAEFRLSFNNLKTKLAKVFDSSSVHELSNLALLGQRDNSVLQNYIFPVKRNIIIELEKNKRFIPYCTKAVFMKAYSNADNQPFYWSETDKKVYFEEIERVIDMIKQ
jgi:hypothetical protein